MGVNFSTFEIGRRALRASQLGINITSQNIANVNTPGYARQGIRLSASEPDGSNPRLIGTGVTIDGVKTFRDQFISSRLETENAINGRLTAQRDSLSPVETAFNEADTSGGINAALTGFFNAFRDLEATPTSPALRASIVEKGNILSSAFQSTRARIVGIRNDTDQDLRGTVDTVNTLADKVADLNKKIKFAELNGDTASELEDQRFEATRQLAELTGTRTSENADGTVNVTFGDGKALVYGETTNKLNVVSTPPDGLAAVQIDGQNAVISDGKIRGLQDAIGSIGSFVQSLDDLANSVATRINTLHSSGIDLNGNPGGVFFTVPASGSITAANIDVSAALKANPRGVVSAAPGGGSADPTIARGIAGLLSDTTSVAGSRTGSFTTIYASIVSDAGAGVKSAEDALTTQQAILSQTEAQRDATSGVSLDEEAINLLQFQRSYEAAARLLKVADEMTQTILAIGQ